MSSEKMLEELRGTLEKHEDSPEAKGHAIISAVLRFMGEHYPSEPQEVINLLTGALVGVGYAINAAPEDLIADVAHRWNSLVELHLPPEEGEAVH
jgi:hypothetical protein